MVDHSESVIGDSDSIAHSGSPFVGKDGGKRAIIFNEGGLFLQAIDGQADRRSKSRGPLDTRKTGIHDAKITHCRLVLCAHLSSVSGVNNALSQKGITS